MQTIIKSIDRTITAEDIIPLLNKYGMLSRLAYEDIIDRAIDSAIKLDQQTQIKLANITQRTTNQLLTTANSAIKTNGDILNQANTIAASISGINSDIREILALEETVKGHVELGGAWMVLPGERTAKLALGKKIGNLSVKSSVIPTDQAGLESLNALGQNVGRVQLSMGLLNLLFPKNQVDMIHERLGIECAMYLGSFIQIDPFTPGYRDQLDVIVATIQTIDLVDDQMCYSLDDQTKPCFSF